LDSAWEDSFQRLEQYVEDHGDCLVPKLFVTKDGAKLGDWVISQRQVHRKGSLSEEQTRRLSEVGFAWNTLDSAWEDSFQLLERYVEDHGDCLVPKSFETKDGNKLGGWVRNQRTRKGSLSEEQTRRLSEVGFAWNTLDSAWEDSFQRLEQYIKDRGDCLVPNSFETKDGYKLGDWVSNQRQRKGTLSEEQTRRLNEVGFEWKLFESAWEENFQRLEQYTEEHGDCLVPISFGTQDGSRLGLWVHTQRQAHRKGSLSKERFRRLNKAGIAWDICESAWELNFQRLEQYTEEHGDCSVPFFLRTQDDVKLGRWVSTQRQAHRKGILSEKRTRRLADVGFIRIG